MCEACRRAEVYRYTLMPDPVGFTPTFDPVGLMRDIKITPPKQEEAPVGQYASKIKEKLDQRRVDAEVERRIKIMESYGEDREDGTVLKFEKALPVSATQTASLTATTMGDYSVTWSPKAGLDLKRNEDGDALKTYSYAALRAAGKWYLTGPKAAGKAYSWQELGLFLAGDGEPVEKLTEMVPVEPLGVRYRRAVDEVHEDLKLPLRTPGEFDEEDKLGPA